MVVCGGQWCYKTLVVYQACGGCLGLVAESSPSGVNIGGGGVNNDGGDVNSGGDGGSGSVS